MWWWPTQVTCSKKIKAIYTRKKHLQFSTWHTSLNGGHTLPEHWTETGFGGGNTYSTGGNATLVKKMLVLLFFFSQKYAKLARSQNRIQVHQ